MTTTNNRILETVTGRDNAEKAIKSWVSCWNGCNGGRDGFSAERMTISKSGLRAYDDEGGSGEFYEAVCLNLNTAESCATEIYEIQTCW